MAGALPAAASAAVYCVAPNKSCNGGNLASLKLAPDFADQLPDADRIFLGQPGGSGVLGLEPPRVRRCTIWLPQNSTDGARGLITSNVARRIEVVEHPRRQTARTAWNSTTERSSRTRP